MLGPIFLSHSRGLAQMSLLILPLHKTKEFSKRKRVRKVLLHSPIPVIGGVFWENNLPPKYIGISDKHLSQAFSSWWNCFFGSVTLEFVFPPHPPPPRPPGPCPPLLPQKLQRSQFTVGEYTTASHVGCFTGINQGVLVDWLCQFPLLFSYFRRYRKP